MPKFRQIKKNDIQEKLHILPSSVATNCINSVLEAGRDGINELPKRQGLVNHGMKCDAKRRRGLIMKDDELSVEFKNSLGYVLLEMPGDYFDTLTGEFKSNVKKMFQYVLMQVNQQAFRDEKLQEDTVTFSCRELIDAGLYSDEFSGDRGIKAAMSILTSIKLKGELKYPHDKKTLRIYMLDVMFYSIKSDNGVFTVYLNTKIDWQFILYFFSHIPTYYYELSSRGASLAYLIFYLARQNTGKIKAEGKFTISLKAVRNALSIPLKATKHTRRDIIEEFFRAADEVEAAHQKHFNNSELELFFINCTDKMTTDEFIKAVNKRGKDAAALEVCMSGALAQLFIEFEEKREAKKKEARKRKKTED